MTNQKHSTFSQIKNVLIKLWVKDFNWLVDPILTSVENRYIINIIALDDKLPKYEWSMFDYVTSKLSEEELETFYYYTLLQWH